MRFPQRIFIQPSKGPYSTTCTSLSLDFVSIEIRKESHTMLFTVSLAFLVPFISAAVLHPNSPDSNDAIFQDQNTTSLTTSLITPLSVTGRLNNTSISNHASTTNSSSLGAVNPPRYPPGYPGQPYDYFVRYSNIRIHCWKFKPDPRQNAEYLNQLFTKLRRKYSDPNNSSLHLWSKGTYDNEYYWSAGDERIGESALVLHLPRSLDRPDFNMTYGDLTNVLIGLNHIIHDYPMLEISMEIYREGFSWEIGLMYVHTYEPEEPDMTEE